MMGCHPNGCMPITHPNRPRIKLNGSVVAYADGWAPARRRHAVREPFAIESLARELPRLGQQDFEYENYRRWLDAMKVSRMCGPAAFESVASASARDARLLEALRSAAEKTPQRRRWPRTAVAKSGEPPTPQGIHGVLAFVSTVTRAAVVLSRAPLDDGGVPGLPAPALNDVLSDVMDEAGVLQGVEYVVLQLGRAAYTALKAPSGANRQKESATYAEEAAQTLRAGILPTRPGSRPVGPSVASRRAVAGLAQAFSDTVNLTPLSVQKFGGVMGLASVGTRSFDPSRYGDSQANSIVVQMSRRTSGQRGSDGVPRSTST